MNPQRLEALEAIVRRVALHPLADGVVLRGGLVARRWLLPLERPVDDVDLLGELDRDAALRLLRELPDVELDDGHRVAAVSEPSSIWSESKFPGLRAIYRVEPAGEEVQLDISFGDPLDPPALPQPFPTQREPWPTLRVVRVENAVSWKLHGLFELPGLQWRPKDLHDLDLLLALPTEVEDLRRAIDLAFSSRDTPLATADRLWEGELGSTRGSRLRWELFRAERPLPSAPVAETVARVCARLGPVVEGMFAPLPVDEGPFPVIEDRETLRAVLGSLHGVVTHEREGLFSVNVERADGWPSPEAARLPRTAYHRRLRRECRGLVFDARGRLISRPYHKFFELGEHPETLPAALEARLRTQPPRVLEKLDGAMVSAGRVDGALRFFTRRGPSALAEAARSRLDARALVRVAALVDAGFTPIFEWCARAHRLVVDYPEPRLVLTALRRRRDGVYLDHAALRDAAEGLEVVACLGRAGSLESLIEAVADAPEGFVLRFDDGAMVKLKSPRYLRLHRAIEAEEPEKARWEVVLSGETELLLPLLPPAEAEALAALRTRVDAALAREIAWIEAEVLRFGPLEAIPKAARGKALHALLTEHPGPRGIALRAAVVGEDAAALVRRMAMSLARGRGASSLRAWLA